MSKGSSFKVGITGHRELTDKASCLVSIRWIISKIRDRILSADPACTLTLLSPLAEGADRLAAREWLSYSEHILETPLPVDVDDYINDFETPDSKEEFRVLLSRSRRQTVMAPQEKRSGSYRAVGVYVVDECDVLLAIWDGKPPVNDAGTAAIVEYARSIDKPLYWVDAKHPEQVIEERLNGIFG